MRSPRSTAKPVTPFPAIVHMLNLLPGEAVVMFRAMAPSVPHAASDLAAAEFHKTLHSLFDPWIASGRSGADHFIDQPQKRNVTFVPRGYRRPIADLLSDWLARNALPQTVDPSGRRVVRDPLPIMQNLQSNPQREGKNVAFWWFLYIMDSPLRYRLTRCMNCNTYFSYKRTPREIIYRGVFCADCPGYAAKFRRDRSREAKLNRMLDAAARVVGHWKRSWRNPGEREWIAEQVNQKCATSITRRWVSQHWEKIQERAEALRNGQG